MMANWVVNTSPSHPCACSVSLWASILDIRPCVTDLRVRSILKGEPSSFFRSESVAGWKETTACSRTILGPGLPFHDINIGLMTLWSQGGVY